MSNSHGTPGLQGYTARNDSAVLCIRIGPCLTCFYHRSSTFSIQRSCRDSHSKSHATKEKCSFAALCDISEGTKCLLKRCAPLRTRWQRANLAANPSYYTTQVRHGSPRSSYPRKTSEPKYYRMQETTETGRDQDNRLRSTNSRDDFAKGRVIGFEI